MPFQECGLLSSQMDADEKRKTGKENQVFHIIENLVLNLDVCAVFSVLVFWCFSVLVFWCFRVLVFWCFCVFGGTLLLVTGMHINLINFINLINPLLSTLINPYQLYQPLLTDLPAQPL